MTRDRHNSLVIEPGKSYRDYWADIWRYRELFFILAWRDVSVRYKQTILGIAWAVLRPLATMIVFTVIFGNVAGLPSDGEAPYALMVFVGLMAWTLFSTALGEAANSLLANVSLIAKVYFPRMIVTAAAVVTALIDFLFATVILGALLVYMQFVPPVTIVFLPFFVLLALGLALGPGLLFAALNVKYRDFRIVVPFIAQFGLYISPVGYSSSLIPEHWRLLYSLNPMVGVIDGFRWSVLGSEASPLYLPAVYISVAFVVLLLALGITRFRRTEKTFADII